MAMERDNRGPAAITRRTVMGVTIAATLPLMMRTQDARAATEAAVVAGVKALTCDVQGTLVDYNRPFLLVSASLDLRKGQRFDWSGFLAAWNAGAVSTILAITAGKRPWIPAGQVFREALDGVLAGRGWGDRFDERDRSELMSIWDRMAPWPDSVEGLRRLRSRFTVAALSNARMEAVIAVAKRGGLDFDAVLTGELAHSYKPSPDVYRAASTYLGFQPGEIMMVAAHKFDLKAAKAVGFRTAYIPRPLEVGSETKVDRSPEPFIDIVADDLISLSTMLGARGANHILS